MGTPFKTEKKANSKEIIMRASKGKGENAEEGMDRGLGRAVPSLREHVSHKS